MGMKSLFLNGDKAIFNLVNGYRCFIFDKTMPSFTLYGSVGFSVIACILLLIFFNNEYNIGIKASLALIGSNLLVQIIKKMANRRRPYMENPNCHTLGHLFKDYSFPSGHTCAAVALSVILSFGFPYFTQLWVVLALLTGILRIYLGQHYPTDVFVGAVIGCIAGFSSIVFI
jgi:undecaprenyl-diphosphatase